MGEGAGTAGADDVTFDSVDALNLRIENLAGLLGDIIDKGKHLADETGWEGPSRDRYASVWYEGGWDGAAGTVGSSEGGETASDVESALNTSVGALHDLSTNANTSATNITEADEESSEII